MTAWSCCLALASLVTWLYFKYYFSPELIVFVHMPPGLIISHPKCSSLSPHFTNVCGFQTHRSHTSPGRPRCSSSYQSFPSSKVSSTYSLYGVCATVLQNYLTILYFPTILEAPGGERSPRYSFTFL